MCVVSQKTQHNSFTFLYGKKRNKNNLKSSFCSKYAKNRNTRDTNTRIKRNGGEVEGEVEGAGDMPSKVLKSHKVAA